MPSPAVAPFAADRNGVDVGPHDVAAGGDEAELADEGLVRRASGMVDWINERGLYTPDQVRNIHVQVQRLLANRLRLKLDRKAASYWQLREPPGPAPVGGSQPSWAANTITSTMPSQ